MMRGTFRRTRSQIHLARGGLPAVAKSAPALGHAIQKFFVSLVVSHLGSHARLRQCVLLSLPRHPRPIRAAHPALNAS
jgi:hypothetical protein